MKRAIQYLLSLHATLILVAVIAGIYLFLTFGNENAWDAVVHLVRESAPVKVIFSLLVLQLLFSGVSRLMRGRFRNLSSSLILISLSLMIGGVFLSVVQRESVRQVLSEGESMPDGLKVLQIELDIPERVLAIGEALDFRIEHAKALLDDHGSNISLREFPPVRRASGFAYINDAGISPALEFRLDGEEVTISTLNVLPPGRRTSVPLVKDYTAEVSLMPSREYQKGRLTAKDYDLLRPRYLVTLKKGNVIIIEQAIAEQGSGEKKGVRISCGDTEKWIEIVIVKDFSLYLLFTGFGGFLGGVILFPFAAYRNLRQRDL